MTAKLFDNDSTANERLKCGLDSLSEKVSKQWTLIAHNSGIAQSNFLQFEVVDEDKDRQLHMRVEVWIAETSFWKELHSEAICAGITENSNPCDVFVDDVLPGLSTKVYRVTFDKSLTNIALEESESHILENNI